MKTLSLSLPRRVEPPRTLALPVLGYLLLNLLSLFATVIASFQADGHTRIVTSLDETLLFGFLVVALLEGRRRLTLSFLALSILGILGACVLLALNVSIGDRWIDISVSACLVIILLLPNGRKWYSLNTTRMRNDTPWKKPASIAVALGWYLLATSLYFSFILLIVDAISVGGVHYLWLVATILLASTAHLHAKQVQSLVRLTRVQFGTSPIVLLVREFKSDEPAGGSERAPKLLPIAFQEEIISNAITHLGTLVTVARPAEHLPSLGALRVKAGHAEWQAVVAYLAKSASFLIVRLPISLTPGIKWEIKEVTKYFSVNRILLLVPNNLPAIKLLRDEFSHLTDEVIISATAAMRPRSDKQLIIGLIGIDLKGQAFFTRFPVGSISALWRNDLKTALRSIFPAASRVKSAT